MKPSLRLILFSCCTAAGLVTMAGRAAPAERQARAPFELRDGDRVALVGDTLIEREPLSGYLEQRLTVEFPERNIIFRNLGWSADSPAGESRASFDFDKPGKGFEKLKEQIAAVRPTVVMIGYGMANSFAGEAGLGKFKEDMSRLIDAIRSPGTNSSRRVLLLSPIRHEELPAPLPNPTEHNRKLALCVRALQDIAHEKNCEFLSLFDMAAGRDKGRPLTQNGIHLTPFGYSRAVVALEQGLGWQANVHEAAIEGRGKGVKSRGGKITDLQSSPEQVSFTMQDEKVVNPVWRDPKGNSDAELSRRCQLQIEGLKGGRYQLKVDGQPVLSATDKEWRRGVAIDRGPQFDQAEELRQAILKKNELYFDRWRPQNETYLFGFRKYEQGQNAKEIPMFDPLIDQQEANIAKLRRPRAHRYEIAVPPSEPRPVAAVTASVANPALKAEPLPEPGFEVAPGFQIQLFAASPLLAKPIQMNFDPKGRLWIASSSVYPQIQPGQVADDRILVLEDTDGDGFAEKSTVFADGLLIPTAVIPGDGGAYVGQSTELLHFKDADGDGKADEKRVVLSAFGTEDTHHMVHTLHWGQDGQLYFNQSIYIHTYIETPHGVEKLNSGGVWHLRPPTEELGVFVKGFCNPWGHQVDEFGQSFLTDGAGGQGISYGLPGATYFTYANMRRELKSISPGSYPKFCGMEIVRSTQFPPDWQGNGITCDFRAHRVVRFAIEEQGSAFAARELSDLVRTTNVTFRPIDVKLGPDGALYIADWSNPIIQHGEVDFRDPRRDHEHGRIWRITAKGRPLVERRDLTVASDKELFEQLLTANAYNQQQARRVLTERGLKIQDSLAKWTKAQSSESALLQALWMYQAIDVVQPRLLEKLLQAKDGRIRAAAMRVLSYWHPRMKNGPDLLARGVADAHPRVRLEAMRALATIPTSRSADLVLSALDKPMDPFLDYAVWLSINDLAQPWLAAVKSGAWKAAGREKQLEFALKAVEPSVANVVLGEVAPRTKFPADGSGPWIELIGTAGDGELLRRLLTQVLENGFDAPTSVRALEALNLAARQRQAKPPGTMPDISPLLKHSNEKIREQAVRLAGAWKLKVVPQLLAMADDKSTSAPLRRAAFESLRDIGGQEVAAGLQPLTSAGHDAWGRRQAITTLMAMDLDKATPGAVALLLETNDEKEAAELWRSLLGIKGAAPKLARALPKTGVPAATAKAGLRVAREGGRNEPDLVWALTRAANLEGESQALSATEMQALGDSVMKEGDAGRGERLFRRADLACVTCHAIGGVGGKVGPDLTSIGASSPVDYLIESVFYPNRKIKEGYSSVIIETKDGLEFSGVLVSENNDQLILRDATDKETTIAKNNIQSRNTGNSLMPAGLVDTLGAGERLDLFRFLAELGKPGPYDASKGNVARAWKLYAQTLDVAQFGDEKVLNTKLSESSWTLARSLVDGRLLKEQLTAALDAVKHRDPTAVYAAARFQVAKAGPVHLKFKGAEGALAWIDGKPLASGGEALKELSDGTHTLVLKLDAKKLPEAITVESPDATFLTN